MYSVGKINPEIYKCITDEILTDEVVITEAQMAHIRDKHPEVVEDTMCYLKEALAVPDYIFSDKREHTGLVIKEITAGKQNVQIVLRICTSGDTPGYKNSVISCWFISRKRLENYLRNKEILYKRE